MDFNLLDAGLCVVLLLFIVRGLLRGMAREAAGLVSIVLGFFIAGRMYPKLMPYLVELVGNPNWRAGIAYVMIFALVLIVVAVFAVILRRFMTLTFAVWLDLVLGGAVGALKGLLLCAVALAVLKHLVPESPFLSTSTLMPYIDDIIQWVRGHLPAFL